MPSNPANLFLVSPKDDPQLQRLNENISRLAAVRPAGEGESDRVEPRSRRSLLHARSTRGNPLPANPDRRRSACLRAQATWSRYLRGMRSTEAHGLGRRYCTRAPLRRALLPRRRTRFVAATLLIEVHAVRRYLLRVMDLVLTGEGIDGSVVVGLSVTIFL